MRFRHLGDFLISELFGVCYFMNFGSTQNREHLYRRRTLKPNAFKAVKVCADPHVRFESNCEFLISCSAFSDGKFYQERL